MNAQGFVDLQVNGFLGTDFSAPQLTVAQILHTAKELSRRGTVAFCPTVTTSSLETYEHVLPVLAEAAATPDGRRRILGIHLEGPFINPAEGAVGVHPASQVKQPDVPLFEHLWTLCNGKLILLTVAPEMPGAMALIRAARNRGVTVSLGHSLCTPQDVALSVANGATLSTHLGNACPNLLNRHNNPIWAQLDSPLSAMLIADGQHLPEAVLRTFIRAKGEKKVVITSDAAPVAGLPPGNYIAFGHAIRITDAGRIENCEAPTLAGSSSTMLECINHLARCGFANEEFLWNVGLNNPLSAIGKSMLDVAPMDSGSIGWNGGAFVINPE